MEAVKAVGRYSMKQQVEDIVRHVRQGRLSEKLQREAILGLFLRKGEFVNWKMSKAQGTAWCNRGTTNRSVWRQGDGEYGGGAGDEVVQGGRGQISQGLGQCDVDYG